MQATAKPETGPGDGAPGPKEPALKVINHHTKLELRAVPVHSSVASAHTKAACNLRHLLSTLTCSASLACSANPTCSAAYSKL